ncbi:amidase, hydantoinase/carbamoylase family [Coriobacterium glomerans PW2]|uniref:Amidase, hydantoinase/carbamoylase family n=1 Tax=Coriobacterium glomerans (strain ATCC 49209 / DSM 20642 / JCM 10262 / PW2) TaxID=700015 RepID=F2N958_CORGP|nr:allantoate deiminase [Coriobacterium glomerans]AEB07734.1 amidase, hydantoinase/carbamoylase family [Coriobacterium glomerans PW2]
MSVTENEIVENVEWLAKNGADPAGGMTRLLFTKEWLAAQLALKQRFEEAGMVASFDEVGNLYGTYSGTDGSEDIIMTGSHVDTVIQGGKYDGALGVIGGFLAVKHLVEEYGRPKKNLTVISMAEEEGSRFPFVFWGSKNLVGSVPASEIADVVDPEGISFADAMRDCGFSLRTSPTSAADHMKAFVELHIEQGNTLEMEDIPVGVVNAIVGQRRYNITLKGEANHAGTTRMCYRHDVIQVFAEIVNRSLGKAVDEGDPLVLTFGHIEVVPNTVNVVPGDAMFTMDCRHTDRAALVRFTEQIEADMAEIAAEHGVEIEIDRWMDADPVPMDPAIVKCVESACKEVGVRYRVMHSGAGHDSQIIAPHIPTGMVFVRSVKGISHSPEEYTEPADLKEGIRTLGAALHALAY